MDEAKLSRLLTSVSSALASGRASCEDLKSWTRGEGWRIANNRLQGIEAAEREFQELREWVRQQPLSRGGGVFEKATACYCSATPMPPCGVCAP